MHLHDLIMHCLTASHGTGHSVIIGRRGRPPGSVGTTSKTSKKVNANDTLQKGLLLHLAEDKDSLRIAGLALKQKLARQKRKPKRLSDNTEPEDLTPRSGQVCTAMSVVFSLRSVSL